MRITDTNRGRIHFPARFGEDFFEQLCAEQKIPKYIRGRRYHMWTLTKNKRNEAWDLQVYNLAALRIICPDTAVLNHYVAQVLAVKPSKPAPPPPEHPVAKAIKERKKPRGNKGGFVNRWKA
jgi:phage terminase large subunit GpA-like protein